MIKINLLAHQGRSEGGHGKRPFIPLSRGMGLSVIILTISGIWVLALNHEHKALLREKVAKERILEKLKGESKQLEFIVNTYATLMARSRTLEQSSDRKFQSVKLMDTISRSLNPFNLWLLRLGVDGKDVEIEGRGLKSDDIQKFVDSLETAAPWGSLLAIETQKESGEGTPLYHFSLRFTLN